MRICLRLTVVLVALLVAACGGAGSTTSQPKSTTPALASLDAVRTGGFAASRRELRLGPGDPGLAGAAEALGIPLPPSSATRNPAANDAFMYSVTAVLSDGTTSSWSFDQSKIPDNLQKLYAWLGTQF